MTELVVAGGEECGRDVSNVPPNACILIELLLPPPCSPLAAGRGSV